MSASWIYCDGVIIIPEFDLEIRTVPKVMSTSLKNAAFRMENGFDFVPYKRGGRHVDIHNLYPTRPFKEQKESGASTRVCFLRDPTQRVLSAYKNRVLVKRQREQQSWADIEKYGLEEQPSIDMFVSKLPEYQRRIANIRHHTAPLTEYLGTDPNYYTHIFNFDQIPEFEGLMFRLSGSVVSLPHNMKSGTAKFRLTWRSRQRLRRMYRDDYRVFGKYM